MYIAFFGCGCKHVVTFASLENKYDMQYQETNFTTSNKRNKQSMNLTFILSRTASAVQTY